MFPVETKAVLNVNDSEERPCDSQKELEKQGPSLSSKSNNASAFKKRAVTLQLVPTFSQEETNRSRPESFGGVRKSCTGS